MRSAIRLSAIALILVPALTLGARPATSRSQPVDDDRAVRLAAPVLSGALDTEVHDVALDAAALERLERDTRVTVRDFPLPGAVPVELELRRVEIVAPDARFVVVDDGGERSVPIPELHAFRGTVAGDPDSLVSLTLVDGRVAGFVRTWDDEFTIAPSTRKAASAAPRAEVARRDRGAEPDAPSMCGGEAHAPADELSTRIGAVRRKTGIDGDTLLRASIAIDTNTEWYAHHGSVAAAQSYVLNLMAEVSAIFESEVNVRLDVGYLRVHTTTDPYTDDTTNTGTLLGELKQEWDLNQTSVSRSAAHLFGRMSGGGSGVAYLDTLCSNDTRPGNSHDYGVSLIIGNGGGWEKELVAHELGHNFSSEHTHCFNPPIDTCSSAPGCYQGATTSSVGTIMSYCGQSTAVFHPRVKDERIRPAAEAAYPTCIERVEPPVTDRVVALADFDGNAAAEIAVGAVDPQTGAFVVEIFDAGSGQRLQTIGYPAGYTATRLRRAASFGGGGADELGIFGVRDDGLLLMQFRDAADGRTVANVFFPSSLAAADVTLSSAFPAIPAPVVAVVGRNLDVDRPQAILKRADSGALVGSYLLHPAFDPKAVAFAPQVPGVQPELLVVSRGATGPTLVQVVQPTTGTVLRNIFFGSIDRPLGVVGLQGLPGHGRAVGVFGHDKTLDRMVLQIRELADGSMIRTVPDHRDFPATEFTIVDHYAGTAAPEVAFVGAAPGSGLVLVQTKDLASGNLVDSLFYGSTHDIRGLAVLDHFSHEGSDELAVLGRERQTGTARVQVRDAGSGSVISNFAP